MTAMLVRAMTVRQPERHQSLARPVPASRRRAAQDRAPGQAIAPADASRIPVHCAERPTPSLSRTGPSLVLQRCGGTECPPSGCDHDDEPAVRRQAVSPAAGLAAAGVSAAVRDVVRSPGRLLAPAVRRIMEPRFWHDFGDVRVHTDAAAARTAREVGARAYTVGHDMVFGDGQFMPDSAAGQRLIAHELAHVIQQRAGGGQLAAQPLTVSSPSDPAEREADRAADAVLSPSAPGGPGPVGAQVGQPAATASCTTVPGSGVPSGLTLPGFGQGSSVLPGSGYPPLLALAGKLRGGDASSELQVHGFASEEGDPNSNVRLSCARASGVRDVCQANGVRNPISLFAHGATEALGPRREDNRAVVVTEPTPITQQQPGEQAAQPGQHAGQQEQQAAGSPTPSCAPDPSCPPEYCMPFATQKEAQDNRAANAESILAGIPVGRARPLFREYIFGGGTLRDISNEFAMDFTNSTDTIATTRLLVKTLEDSIKSSPPIFPPGASAVTVNLTDVLSEGALNQILAQLVFTNIFEVPGLIAGGIGINQSACPVGAIPSSQDDARLAEGTITVGKNMDGSLSILPSITFTVKDTLDFCPGNCGGPFAQILTVPMSRWEASLISGDVPFIVRFPAPSLTGAFDDADVE